MKLRAVTLNEVRQFDTPVRVAGIGDGLNVLSAPNETGKSTLFDAIHAVLFIPHRSSKIKPLRPAVGGNPEITLEIEHEGAALVLFKRWGRGATAEVRKAGVVVARADEAEAMIAGLTRAQAEAGPSGLLWVRQGVTDLDGDDKATRQSRQDLMSSVTGEIAALTGGKRMDRALAQAREELERLETSRGAKAGGALDLALKAVAGLNERIEALEERAGRLGAALAERRGKRRALAELTDPAEAQQRRARLAAAKAAFEAADRHASALQGAVAALQAADLARAGARREIEARGKTALAVAALTRQGAEAETAAAQALARDTGAQAALSAAQAAEAQARGALRGADAALQAALRAEAQRANADRHARLADDLAQAQALVARLADLRAAAASGPDARQLDAIDKAAQALALAEGLAQAAAPQLSLTQPEGAPPVLLAGVPLGPQARPLTEAAVLDLPGLGRLRIAPGAGDAPDRLARARGALAQALTQAGAGAPDTARAAARARQDAGRALAEAQEALKRRAPEGIEALKAELARLAPQDLAGAPDLAEAQAALEAARSAETAAEAATARARVEAAAAAEARITTAHASADLGRRLAEARAALAEMPDAAALDTALAAAEAAHDSARTRHAALAADAPDLEACRAALARAQSVADEAASEINALNVALASLDATVATLSGEGVEEELADARLRLASARAAEAAQRHEVAVLRRLIGALEGAQAAARDRYFEPVLTELRPMLRLLWPGAELVFDGDSLLPSHLLRAGRTEALETLSGGTREQIALLVRLAFARLLAKSGRHAPVILDDALVYTDDERMEAMFNALYTQADDLQILLLSCRNRALRHLGGRKLQFEPAS